MIEKPLYRSTPTMRNYVINYLLKLNGIYGVLRTLKLKLSATYLTIRSWRKGNEYETNIV